MKLKIHKFYYSHGIQFKIRTKYHESYSHTFLQNRGAYMHISDVFELYLGLCILSPIFMGYSELDDYIVDLIYRNFKRNDKVFYRLKDLIFNTLQELE